MKIISTLFLAGILVVIQTHAFADESIYGVWRPVEYKLSGRDMPLRGLMIITKDYFVGNVTFDEDGDGVLEANANSGPITVENGKLVIQQWMQLHWRENDPKEHYLREDIPEEINYTVEGNKLIFHFPSGNRYISERLE